MSEAKHLTAALGGHWYGQYGTAPCPVCQSEGRSDQTALTLRDGRRSLLLHCKKSGCRFADILRAAGCPTTRREHSQGDHRKAGRRTDSRTGYHARNLWAASEPIEGSPAETYLRQIRKVDLPSAGTLRYNPVTWHGPTRQSLPAMIALIDHADGIAVSRTYLRANGSGKADLPRQTQKLMLGAAAGGHVTLMTGAGPLVVAEGIETALSVPRVFPGRPITLWAALSASNMRNLALPALPGHLVIATDGEPAGRAAGEALRSRARSLGWVVEIRSAPDGQDWNDVWIECAGATGAVGRPRQPKRRDGNGNQRA
ncbi:Toprim domain-containing protein [Rhodovulum bhavnagarense]|uniref:Toprim domain-containing protein n=1 Tax=Rhodovulum bhavnagarense TaxID=992286 RepID=A0A4R2R602_9RHOB|nr:toprim domain-containing protein [Rhodovulum bhavnagarense]TCP58432.1 Toprim domain-containing protein [Rhodovulum bhavnagarense]